MHRIASILTRPITLKSKPFISKHQSKTVYFRVLITDEGRQDEVQVVTHYLTGEMSKFTNKCISRFVDTGWPLLAHSVYQLYRVAQKTWHHYFVRVNLTKY